MAIRPVFYTLDRAPFYSTSDTDFVWVKGMSLSQQQKNALALHDAFLRRFPDKKILEISGKSLVPCGIAASAFFLQKFIPSLRKSVSVESIYQSSKVFANGGPFTDLLEKSSKEAKSDERLKKSGALTAFRFENEDYPTEPKTIFYDFIYINALMENSELAEKIKQYDAFTDIAFNPQRSINCQARAAAIFVSLAGLGLLEKAKDFRSFAELFQIKTLAPTRIKTKAPEILRPSYITSNLIAPAREDDDSDALLKKDTVIEHRFFKKGNVLSLSPDGYVKIFFDSVGEKTLAYDWVIRNCKIAK